MLQNMHLYRVTRSRYNLERFCHGVIRPSLFCIGAHGLGLEKGTEVVERSTATQGRGKMGEATDSSF